MNLPVQNSKIFAFKL